MTSRFDAILFDKDGTIFDSEALNCRAWVQTAQKFNLEFTKQMYAAFIGVSTAECYRIAHRQFGCDFPMENFINEIRHFINVEKAKGPVVKPGFHAFFMHVKSLNILTGVVTSAGYESTMLSFQGTDYASMLDVLVTVDDVAHPKPSPQCYILACKKLNVNPKNVLVFEDSPLGLQASLAAGCCTVAIPDLASIPSELASKCKRILMSFEEAYPLLV